MGVESLLYLNQVRLPGIEKWPLAPVWTAQLFQSQDKLNFDLLTYFRALQGQIKVKRL